MRHLAASTAIAMLLGALALTACTGEIGSPTPSTQGSGEPSAPGQGPGQTATTGEPGTPGTPNEPGGPGVVQEGGEGAGEAITGSSCAEVGVDTGPNVLRRLTRTEYQLTLQDLLHLETPPNIEAIAADVAQDGFTAYAEVHTVSAVLLRSYLEVARAQAALLKAESGRRQQVLGCDST